MKAKNAALGMMTEGCVFLLEIGVLNCVLSGKCRKMQNTLQMMLKLDADIQMLKNEWQVFIFGSNMQSETANGLKTHI
jgi:hypothetical protein